MAPALRSGDRSTATPIPKGTAAPILNPSDAGSDRRYRWTMPVLLLVAACLLLGLDVTPLWDQDEAMMQHRTRGLGASPPRATPEPVDLGDVDALRDEGSRAIASAALAKDLAS